MARKPTETDAAPDPAPVPETPPPETPPPAVEQVHVRVLDRLIHDGVTYSPDSIVTLTPAQHAELAKAGVVSADPAEAPPY